MDIRILNTCNNNCLYCLEQELREKNPYISLNILEGKISDNIDNNITFYGGNPLLHPELLQIIRKSSKHGKSSIGILSNTGGLDKNLLEKLMKNGLNNFGFYFYSFQENIHTIYSGGNISLKELCKNINIISQANIYSKAIIHIHKGNIANIFHDIEILYNKFGIKNFEFIDYLLVDRAIKYGKLLEYQIVKNRKNIDKLFITIKQLNIQVKFVRFKQDFFGKYQEFNDNKQGKQI